MILIQGSDRIDSFWFAKIWFTKVNQKSQKDFDSRGCLFLFLIHVSESFYLWFWSILIAFQNWFVKIWFAKVNQKSQKDFDSRGESKSFFFLFLIHVGESFYFCDSDPFWFTFKANIIHFYSQFIFIFIHFDLRFKWFYSFWFGLILIRRESRFTRESWFTCESKSNRIKKSKVGESWFTHLRIIIWFDFKSESKWIANQGGSSPA